MVGYVCLGLSALGFTYWTLHKLARRPPRAKLLPRGQKLTVDAPDEISVVCYNILADNLVSNNEHAYLYGNPVYMSWEYRWCMLQEEFASFGSDIICLQEVEKDRWPEFVFVMRALGYSGIMQSPKKTHMTIATAIFYKSNRFKVVWEEHRSRALGIGLTYTDSNGQSQVLYVVNWHLEGDPRRAPDRISQMKSILQRMAAIQGKSAERADVVIAGDFNATRWNAPWQFLFRGRLEGGYTEAYLPHVPVTSKTVAHPYALQDVYMAGRWIPEFTTRAPRRRSEVDFIWCSRHLKVEALMRPANPRHIGLVDRTLLPNKDFPSDHLPLGVVLSRPEPTEPCQPG